MIYSYMGIDPGAKGAVAWLYDSGVLVVMDFPIGEDGKPDHFALATMMPVQSMTTRQALLESVHAMPGQGVTSMFSMGVNYGAWKQVLYCNRVLFHEVTPQWWKKRMEVTADKQTSIDKACWLFPSQKHLFYGPKGGIKDGRAEAALLAYLAKREWEKQHG